jgi:hypothetical protein
MDARQVPLACPALKFSPVVRRVSFLRQRPQSLADSPVIQIGVHACPSPLGSNHSRNLACARARCDFEKLIVRPNNRAISSCE